VIDQDAFLLRENTRTTGLEQTARAAAEVLAHFGIPHLIGGGLAVQEHGCPRVTLGVEELISLKLDSRAGAPLRRHKAGSDVIEIIENCKRRRDLRVAPAVRPLYVATWDALQAEA
jgi:hypothetical protein